MTEEEYTDRKQICFSLETDLEFAQDALQEAVKMFLPKGTVVNVKRGNGVLRNVEVIAVHRRESAGTFSGKTTNGKVHIFHYKNVIL